MKTKTTYATPKEVTSQIITAGGFFLSTPKFIAKHKLWKGFFDHKWIMILTIIISILFTLLLYSNIEEHFFPSEKSETSISINIGNDDETKPVLLEEEEEEDDDDDDDDDETDESKENHAPLFDGSMKFLLLIFLQVFLYHFAVNTNNILKGNNQRASLKNFSKAQHRIIKLMGRKWFYGIIAYVLVSVLLWMINLQAIKETIMFIIYGYFLGFAFLDNYLEQYDYSIKESAQKTRSHLGASTFFGMATSALIHIPILGPLLVPFLCGIAAVRYGHQQRIEE